MIINTIHPALVTGRDIAHDPLYRGIPGQFWSDESGPKQVKKAALVSR